MSTTGERSLAMALQGEKRKMRTMDHPVFKAVQILGLPTVLCIMLFWAWDRDRHAERMEWKARDERNAVAWARLADALDRQALEMTRLSERMVRLEDLGARAMDRRGSTKNGKE